MKIATYNVNGLRPRISQYGSLRKLLDSLDSDIICFQETKLSRQELRADVVSADVYESFFSCTRSLEKGRTGYSGVATFCKVQSAFSSNEVALPLDAEEGFTGVLETSKGFTTTKHDLPTSVEGLEEFDRNDLLKIDSEGRCIITDHGHFVLFNIYGPRAACDDTERIEFKLSFYKTLHKRWESLMLKGRRIIVVGDLNIAPFSIDRCDAGPDFENNEFRSWFRSLLVESGGFFFDVFRSKHPERKEAYTCWSTSTGGEMFNFGSRIDHILITGTCLHEDNNKDSKSHNFFSCHVKECDILTQFKRWKPGTTPSYKWKGEKSIKLEGSDHAPVFMSLIKLPHIEFHNTPSLSTRYCPQVRGCQQTLVSMLSKRQSIEEIKSRDTSLDEDIKESSSNVSVDKKTFNFGFNQKKKSKKNQSSHSQMSLKSFFQTSSKSESVVEVCETEVMETEKFNKSESDDKSKIALLEWQRIQEFMKKTIPVCKGHGEQCVSRVVKKAGPTFGRRFYVCARAEGPASNPEANCGYFSWADSGSKRKEKK